VVAGLTVVKIDPASMPSGYFTGRPGPLPPGKRSLRPHRVQRQLLYPQRPALRPCHCDANPSAPRATGRCGGCSWRNPRHVPDLPRATILDLLTTRVDPKKLPWTQACNPSVVAGL